MAVPPVDLGPAGREWWAEVHAGDVEATPAEYLLIVEIGRTLDLLDNLRKSLAEVGPLVVGAKGGLIANPALNAIAAAQRSLGQLIKQLNLTDDDDSPPARRPHPATSARSRKAAESRWRSA